MPYRVRSGAGSGGGGTTPSVFTYSDSLSRTDQPVFNLTQTDSYAKSDDAFTTTLTLPDTTARQDAYVAGAVSAVITDTAGRSDSMTVSLVLPAVPRSGSPDADNWGNCWTDHTTGNTTVNHSNFNPAGTNMQVANNVANVGELRAYIEFDLTGLTGFTPVTGGLHKFEFALFNGSAGFATTQDCILELFTTATRPFTESTATDASPPTIGTTVVGTTTFTAAATSGYQAMTLTLTDAQATSMLTKWCLVRFVRIAAALNAVAMGVAPRESTADSSTRKPKLTLTLQR